MISNDGSEVILAKRLAVALPNMTAKRWFQPAPMVPIFRDIDLRAKKGQCLGIVGESGSGKSVTSLSINRLIPNPPGEIVSGEIIYNGINLLDLSYEEMRNYRGKDISMISLKINP